jgi:uncharacterized membrane protein (UPF0127 family)
MIRSRGFRERREPWVLLLVILAAVLAAGQSQALLAQPPAGADVRPDALLVFSSPDGSAIQAQIRIEIAADPAAWNRGLMWRVLPDDTQGMLFVYPDSAPRVFWMRNTPAALDILYADAERRVSHIVRNAQPMSDRLHGSKGPARYVIEVRGGFAARHGIVEGARFHISRLPPP